MNVTKELAQYLMDEALCEAKKASQAGEVPVGAVLWDGDKIVARSHNRVEKDKQATSHAEVLLINEAGKFLDNWRLNTSVLCVTLEPCSMCAGAIKLARIPVIIYGAKDERMGAFGSLFNLAQDKRLGPVPRVISGVMEEECAEILQKFFQEKRAQN